MLTLEGPHARLVPLDFSHADALLIAATENRSTYDFTAVPSDAAQMRSFIEGAHAEAARGVSIPFTTIDARTNRVVGSTRFLTIDRWAPFFGPPLPKDSAPSAVEIGSTWLAGSAQRTRINTDAKRLMLQHAFEQWQVHRVTLKTDARNLRSRNAIKRLGAIEDGVLRAWQLASDGGPRDTAVYSIIAAEWPEVRARLERALST